MSISLNVVSQTSTKITFAWTPVAGCAGYVFYADGKRVSNSWDPQKSSVTFAKGASAYRVDAVAVSDSGSYPPPLPPPPPPSVPTMKKPYRADSWVNTPVDPNQPNILKRSDQVINWMVNIAPLGYHLSLGGQGCPVYLADANTPRVTVQQNLRSYASKMWANVPIDPSWRPGSNGLAGVEAEPDMCIFDTNGDEWFFYKATAPGLTPMDGWLPANQYWQATGVGVTKGTGEPGGWQGTGAMGSAGSTTYHDGGENAGAGKVKNSETLLPAGSDWGHALICSAPRVCNGHIYPSSFVSSSVTYPVTDLTAVPSGTRYWLPPSYDIEGATCDWPNNTFGGSGNWYGKPLAEVDKQLLRTMRRYGCYINDQNGGPQFSNDNSIGIGTEGLWYPKLRGETTIGWEHSVMAPWYPRLPRSAVAALKVTSFLPQSTY